jgi:Flp pilus assembly protein TadB
MTIDTNAKPKSMDLEAFAFYQGAHAVPLEETVKEIATAHDMERAKLQEQSIRREKPFEAERARLEQERTEIDAVWNAVVRRLGLNTPSVVPAVVVGLLGLTALVVDALFVAPGLDAVGITDPALQFVAACGLAALSATLFHLAYETFGDHKHSVEMTIARRALAVVAMLSLLAWGILRGFQAKFGADLTQNPLGQFLGEHPMLAAIFFCFVTLAAPLIGAAAFHDAAPRIHQWLIWRRAKYAYVKLHRDLTTAEKKLDEERLARVQSINRLDAQQHNWEAVAAQYHDRGRQHGARQEPHWVVVLKATAWSLVGLVVGSVLGRFLGPLYFALPGLAWVVAFLYYRRARFSPTYGEYKRQENAWFAIRTDRPHIVLTPPPKLLPPPKEDS